MVPPRGRANVGGEAVNCILPWLEEGIESLRASYRGSELLMVVAVLAVSMVVILVLVTGAR